jgi:hypothetical protein
VLLVEAAALEETTAPLSKVNIVVSLRAAVLLLFLTFPARMWWRGGVVRQRGVREVVPFLAGRGGEGEMQSGVPYAAAHGRWFVGFPVLYTGRCGATPLLF